MKCIKILLLALLVSLAIPSVAHAYTHDTIDNIQVPRNVTWGTQIKWQGHIVYSVENLGSSYRVKVARDGEPHQYPYFYVSFSKNWEYQGTVRRVNPEAERRAKEEARRRAEEQQRREQEAARQAQEEQRRQQEEERRREEARREAEERKREEKPEPPVVKPPEEEEQEEPEEPEEQ